MQPMFLSVLVLVLSLLVAPASGLASGDAGEIWGSDYFPNVTLGKNINNRWLPERQDRL